MELKCQVCKETFVIKPFNRTLWNWNGEGKHEFDGYLSFNRTLWNWNELREGDVDPEYWLLIVPYGIEIG